VTFEILHPGPLPAEAPRTKAEGRPNHRSCVLQITDAKGHRALLTGDIEAPDEAEMLARGQVLPSEVLVLPHHGSRTSSTPALIAAVAPRLALAQAGYRNRFGHPHPAVLARFDAAGIPVWQSAGCGAWRWLSGERRPRCERDRAPRYWDEQALAPPPELELEPAPTPTTRRRPLGTPPPETSPYRSPPGQPRRATPPAAGASQASPSPLLHRGPDPPFVPEVPEAPWVADLPAFAG
jgi:competence protein ComEC